MDQVKALLPTLSILGLAQVIILAAQQMANRLRGLDIEDLQGFGTSDDDEENPAPPKTAEPAAAPEATGDEAVGSAPQPPWERLRKECAQSGYQPRRYEECFGTCILSGCNARCVRTKVGHSNCKRRRHLHLR